MLQVTGNPKVLHPSTSGWLGRKMGQPGEENVEDIVTIEVD